MKYSQLAWPGLTIPTGQDDIQSLPAQPGEEAVLKYSAEFGVEAGVWSWVLLQSPLTRPPSGLWRGRGETGLATQTLTDPRRIVDFTDVDITLHWMLRWLLRSDTVTVTVIVVSSYYRFSFIVTPILATNIHILTVWFLPQKKILMIQGYRVF